MASKEAVLELMKKNSESFNAPFTEAKFNIWLDVMKGDDYPDQMLVDAFNEHLESEDWPITVAAICKFRRANYTRYKQLVEIANTTGREF